MNIFSINLGLNRNKLNPQTKLLKIQLQNRNNNKENKTIFASKVMKYFRLCFFTLFFFSLQPKELYADNQQLAITCVPVADLVGQSLKHHKYYSTTALCAKEGIYGCPRIHQLLLHQPVTILEESGDEVKIKIPHVFYDTDAEKNCTTYWSLKKNFILLSQLEAKRVDLAKLPSSLDFTSNEQKDTNIITLCKPHYLPSLHITLSAGTRFVRTIEKEPAKDTIAMYILNPHTKKIQTIMVPKSSCITTKTLSRRKKIDLFLKLIKEWASLDNGFIAYVWGGCSFVTPCLYDQFTVHNGFSYKGKQVSYYVRSELRSAPVSGLDCAGLIVLASHIAGIPFYYKNSATIAHYLKPLEEDKVQNGDLLWFPGHVLVLADVKKNTIIEARAYSHGYGKVHELPLNQVFKDITTTDDLVKAYRAQEPLSRLMKDGSVAQTITNYKILKLNSVWE